MDAVELVLVHLLQNPGQHPVLTAGFEEEVNLAVMGAAAQNAHVQPPGDEAHHPVDAPVFGKLSKLASANRMSGGGGKFLQGKADILKAKSLADQFVGQLGGYRPAHRAQLRVSRMKICFSGCSSRTISRAESAAL